MARARFKARLGRGSARSRRRRSTHRPSRVGARCIQRYAAPQLAPLGCIHLSTSRLYRGAGAETEGRGNGEQAATIAVPLAPIDAVRQHRWRRDGHRVCRTPAGLDHWTGAGPGGRGNGEQVTPVAVERGTEICRRCSAELVPASATGRHCRHRGRHRACRTPAGLDH